MPRSARPEPPGGYKWSGPVLTAWQLAAMLHLSVDHVRKLTREGQLPARRLPGGREFRYFEDEVFAWLQEQPLASDQDGDEDL